MRGGISYIAKRYSEANNKYIKNYNPTNTSKYIEYLDQNNFYGWVMSRYPPYGGFKWLKNVDNSDEYSISENRIGYIQQDVSDYCKKVSDKYGINVGDVKKLVPNLGDKTNYIVRYKYLQLYLSLGMKLTKYSD